MDLETQQTVDNQVDGGETVTLRVLLNVVNNPQRYVPKQTILSHLLHGRQRHGVSH